MSEVPRLPPHTGPNEWHSSQYWADLERDGKMPPLEHIHAPQDDDFSTMLPHEAPGERMPDAVMVRGAIVRPPTQARTTLADRELDRRRAHDVIAHAAIAYIDSHHTDRAATYEALCDAIAENKDVVA